MAALENEQHEAFAQARFAGKALVEAHYAAGYADDKASPSRLNRLHEVQERIAELFREAAAHTANPEPVADPEPVEGLKYRRTAPADAGKSSQIKADQGKNISYASSTVFQSPVNSDLIRVNPAKSEISPSSTPKTQFVLRNFAPAR